MREILFRGKRKDNGEWSFGDLLHSNTGKTYIVELVDDDSGRIIRICHIEVNPTTIGQYTGLTDKNGTKIFEGDVVKWDSKEWGSEYAEVVKWDYEIFTIRESAWKEFCEVIGNIHDATEGVAE